MIPWSCKKCALQTPKDITALAKSHNPPAPTPAANGDKDAAPEGSFKVTWEALSQHKVHFSIASGLQASLSVMWSVKSRFFSILLNEKWKTSTLTLLPTISSKLVKFYQTSILSSCQFTFFPKYMVDVTKTVFLQSMWEN